MQHSARAHPDAHGTHAAPHGAHHDGAHAHAPHHGAHGTHDAHHGAHAHHHHHDAHDHTPQPWTILVLLSIAQFMVILDITVVNVALPSIGRALDVARTDLQWVITAYVLFGGGLLMLGGRAADLLGRRRVLLTGLLLFTAASLASGLAPSSGALIASRAVQGLGAALLTPAALSIIVTTYTGPQHATALSVWGALGAAGSAAGLLLGGMLTTWLSWEWIFFVNVPVGVAVALLAVRIVPASGPAASGAGRRLDIPGAASLVAGLAALIYALEGAADHGWGSAHTLLFLGLSGLLLAAFAAIERMAAHPLVPPQTWRSGSLVGGAAVMLAATGILVGSFFLNSVYLQDVQDASALETGLGFLPIALSIAFAAHVAAHLMPRLGSRVVAALGLGLITLAAVLLTAAPDDASFAGDLLPGFVALGLGAGLTFPSASVTAMSRVTHETAGLSAGVMMTAHETGAALGVAALSAIAAGTTGGFAAGYGDGFLAAAVAAGALVLVVLLALPAVRPAPGTRVGMH